MWVENRFINCILGISEATMIHYLVEAAYKAEAVAALMQNPQNRRDTVKQAIEILGGRLDGFLFAFGITM